MNKVISTIEGKYHPQREGIILVLNGREFHIPERGQLIEIYVIIDGERYEQSIIPSGGVIEILNNYHMYFNQLPLTGAEIHPSIRTDPGLISSY